MCLSFVPRWRAHTQNEVLSDSQRCDRCLCSLIRNHTCLYIGTSALGPWPLLNPAIWMNEWSRKSPSTLISKSGRRSPCMTNSGLDLNAIDAPRFVWPECACEEHEGERKGRKERKIRRTGRYWRGYSIVLQHHHEGTTQITQLGQVALFPCLFAFSLLPTPAGRHRTNNRHPIHTRRTAAESDQGYQELQERCALDPQLRGWRFFLCRRRVGGR